MKQFEEIIREYQLLYSTKVRKLLETHDLLNIMHSTCTLLSSGSGNPGEQLNISSLVSNFITITSGRISSIQCDSQKSKMEFILISLSEKILMEYMIKNSSQQKIIIPQVEEAIRTTCKQCNYNFGPFEKLLKYKVQSIALGFDKKENGIKIKTDNTGKCRSIHWLDKGKLFELIDLLKRKKYIKRKKEMFAFFQTPTNGLIVHCCTEKKYHIAYLLYRLFNENYARITGNRGFFCCAELMFTDMEGRPFKRNSLRKISSKICKDKERYSHIRKEVDSIISRITKGTNGL
jgi:hypothetical protein